MSELETTGGATTGEPETEAVVQPVDGEMEAGTGAATAGDPDPDLVEKLKTVDWNKIPADVRSRIEKPFLSEFNRKIEDQRKAFESRTQDAQTRALQAIADKLAASAPQVPDGTAELLERAKAGDPEALVEYQQKMLQQNLEPIQRQQQLSAQYAEAARFVPELQIPEFNSQVGQVIQNDPVANELFNRDGHKFASRVIQAAANMVKVSLLEKALADEKAGRETAVKRAIEEHRAKVAGLPARTTLAGSTPSGTPGKSAPRTMREAMPSKAEWVAMGGSPDAYDE